VKELSAFKHINLLKCSNIGSWMTHFGRFIPPGPVRTGAENLAPTGILSPDRPALNRLSFIFIPFWGDIISILFFPGGTPWRHTRRFSDGPAKRTQNNQRWRSCEVWQLHRQIWAMRLNHTASTKSCPPSVHFFVYSDQCIDMTQGQRFSNFFQVGTTFISQNVLLTALLLSPLKASLSFFKCSQHILIPAYWYC
jgi:hypothetical protein